LIGREPEATETIRGNMLYAINGGTSHFTAVQGSDTRITDIFPAAYYYGLPTAKVGANILYDGSPIQNLITLNALTAVFTVTNAGVYYMSTANITPASGTYTLSVFIPAGGIEKVQGRNIPNSAGNYSWTTTGSFVVAAGGTFEIQSNFGAITGGINGAISIYRIA